MDKIRAPYNFVPLAANVVTPDWSVSASHDVPFPDGICGTLSLRAVAQTPVFTRDGGSERGKLQGFFKLRDGTHALPGTTVKGCIRSVLEIASFGRMWRVNQDTYGVRDLHNPELYGKHMAAVQEGLHGRKEPLPLVGAGWLERDANNYIVIRPCDFAKIEYRTLMQIARDRGVRSFSPGTRQSAPDKYAAWGAASRQVNVGVEWLRGPVLRGGAPVRFGKVSGAGGSPGTLVFTGQPSEWRPDDARRRPGGGHPKHHDFVFLDTPPIRPITVTNDVWRAFQFVHSAGGESHATTDAPNEEWKFWRDRYLRREPVPVFYLVEGGQLRAMGLAMMFRLAYRYSVGDAIRNTQPDSLPPLGEPASARQQTPDLAQTIFGYVMDGAEGAAGKGRVSFGTLRLEGAPRLAEEVSAVLGAPKASYYPNYVEQGADGGGPARLPGGQPRYSTYMDEGVRVRGWKRYQPKTRPIKPPPPATSTGKAALSEHVGTRFLPLAAGSTFSGAVRVHNLLPVELGALLWALDFGGHPGAMHTIGMGRPLGYGAVTFEVAAHALETVRGEPVDLAACVQAYAAWMERQVAGWASSRQVHELLALAVPLANPEDGRHMRLDHPDFRNEFVTAKKEGMYLEPAGKSTWRARAATSVPSDGGRREPQAGPVAAGGGAPAQATAPIGAGRSPQLAGLLAEIDTLKGHNFAGRLSGVVARARALGTADRAEAGRALIARMEQVWKDGKKNPLYPEIRGWVG